VIRKRRQTPIEGHARVSRHQDPRAIVEADRWAAYWMSVDRGLVRFGRGEVPGREVVLEWQDPSPLQGLRWVAFSSWDTPIDFRMVRVSSASP